MPEFTQPSARAMKKYVELPPAVAGDPAALRRWIEQGRKRLSLTA